MSGFNSDSPLYTIPAADTPEAEAVQQSQYSGNVPWRATYGQVAPMAVQWLAEVNGGPGGSEGAPSTYDPSEYYSGSQASGGYAGQNGPPPEQVSEIPGYPGPSPQITSQEASPQGYQGTTSAAQYANQETAPQYTYGYSPYQGTQSTLNAFDIPGTPAPAPITTGSTISGLFKSVGL
jgi:hypothetical protein